MRAKNSVIGVYKSESLKPVIDAGHMPFYQIIRKLGLVERDQPCPAQAQVVPLRWAEKVRAARARLRLIVASSESYC